MNESANLPPKKTKKNIYALFFRSLAIGVGIITICLYVGMIGYRHYENMSWVDAYVNASMILSGMGPVGALQTDAGKIFAGTYALFSGTLFLVVIAIIFAPIIHRFFLKIHLEDKNDKLK